MITKRIFVKILNFLGGFGGLTDLGDCAFQEELWGNYKEENKKKKK